MIIFFFVFPEESMDVDPNYDPSDFLMAGLPKLKEEVLDIKPEKIHDDLAVSESEEECAPVQQSSHHLMNEEDDAGDLWF